MAIIYYPTSTTMVRQDSVNTSYTQLFLTNQPNTIFVFDSGSNLSVLSSSLFYLTSSNSVLSDTASYILNKVTMTNRTILFSDSGSNPLSTNEGRIQWSISNMGTDPLYIKYGLGCNSSSLGGYDRILLGGNTNDDGYGQTFDDGEWSVWGGAVSVTGSSLRYICTERY